MHWAEVGTTSTYSHLLKKTRTTSFGAESFMFEIRAVVVLEATLLTLDIFVITHRVSTEVDPFLQSLLHRFKHFP